MINPYSTTLARAAARGVMMSRARKRSRTTAFRASGFVARQAARRIYRWYRKRKKRSARSKIGDPAGKSSCKRDATFIEQYSLKSSRTLYLQNLTDLERSDTDNVLNRRQRDIVNFRGVKLCFEVANAISTAPMHFNYAVISPRGRNIANTVSDITNSFFRGDQSLRNKDFGTARSGLELHCNPINTDKWHVLTHKRYTLHPANSTSGAKYWRSIQKYVKLNKQIRYDMTQANIELQCETPLLLVWWCDQFGTAANDPVVNNSMRVAQRHISYFREPRG